MTMMREGGEVMVSMVPLLASSQAHRLWVMVSKEVMVEVILPLPIMEVITTHLVTTTGETVTVVIMDNRAGALLEETEIGDMATEIDMIMQSQETKTKKGQSHLETITETGLNQQSHRKETILLLSQ